MYFVRTPYILKMLFQKVIWEFPPSQQTIYLTFDDGPHQVITPWILSQLKRHDAKATFFCLGENAKKYPNLILEMERDGHAIASHGDAHLNGWKISKTEYEQNILQGKQTLSAILQKDIPLFRPPYGRFKHKVMPTQQIILWSLMPGDFDSSITAEKCLSRLKSVKAGDIIVLHENEKSWKNLQYCLPKFLEFCKANNFQLSAIKNV